MIEIKHLCKSFGNNVIFNDFNITVEDGEFVVFAGKSGCGKTTLLNMIGALEKPTDGKILIDGRDIGLKKNQKDYFRSTVGFLFQNFALIENKTVRQNLELVQKKFRTGVTVEQALKAVGLEGKEEEPIFRLSGGEQQRASLARLMLKKCSLILADEPTGSLDSENAGSVLEILRRMNSDGKTVVLVTHDERIISSAKRVVQL